MTLLNSMGKFYYLTNLTSAIKFVFLLEVFNHSYRSIILRNQVKGQSAILLNYKMVAIKFYNFIQRKEFFELSLNKESRKEFMSYIFVTQNIEEVLK